MKRLRNSTNIAPEIVKQIEAFVMPPGGVGAYDLELRNSVGATCGRAYYAGSGYHSTARPFIVVRLSRHERYASAGPPRPKAGYLPLPARGSRVEQLVHLLAHELRHLWQARVKSGRRVWGARGQFSERDADAWAIRCLRQWRRQNMGPTAREVRASVQRDGASCSQPTVIAAVVMASVGPSRPMSPKQRNP